MASGGRESTNVFRPGRAAAVVLAAGLAATPTVTPTMTLAARASDAGATEPQTAAPAPSADCDHGRAVVGAVLGAVMGNLLGARIAGKRNAAMGRLVGTGAGAVFGGAIGAELDRRACRLKALARQYNVELTAERIEAPRDTALSQPGAQDPPAGLAVTLPDRGHQFQAGSDVLSDDARRFFDQAAETYAPKAAEPTGPGEPADPAAAAALQRRVVLLMGHTDDTGSASANAALAERRAKAVARLFEAHGVPGDRIYYQGAGEAYPIADNRTDAGRAENRRVEIVDLPDETALTAYLAARAPRVENYRPSNAATPAPETDSSPHPTASPRPTVSATRTAAPSPARRRMSPSPAPSPSTRPGPDSRTPPALAAAPLAAAPQAAAPKAAAPKAAWDFGGAPVSGTTPPDIGRLQTRRPGATLGSRAEAATLDRLGLAACSTDKPHTAYPVKGLRTGQPLPFPTAEFMPGLYGGAWRDRVNSHMVALTGVAVLRSGVAPSPPTLVLYRDYAKRPDPRRAPDVTAAADVNVYRGEKGLLYRVFPGGRHEIDCIDLVLPADGGVRSNNSTIYYTNSGRTYSVPFSPAQVSR